jgi:hypothetical protein
MCSTKVDHENARRSGLLRRRQEFSESPPQVDRVLQVRHGSQLEQLEAAFAAVGKQISFTVDDIPGAIITKAKAASPSGRVRRLAAKKR